MVSSGVRYNMRITGPARNEPDISSLVFTDRVTPHKLTTSNTVMGTSKDNQSQLLLKESFGHEAQPLTILLTWQELDIWLEIAAEDKTYWMLWHLGVLHQHMWLPLNLLFRARALLASSSRKTSLASASLCSSATIKSSAIYKHFCAK